jgi:hypothetical protein
MDNEEDSFEVMKYPQMWLSGKTVVYVSNPIAVVALYYLHHVRAHRSFPELTRCGT